MVKEIDIVWILLFTIPVEKCFNIFTSGILNSQEGIQFHLSFYWRNKANIEFPLFCSNWHLTIQILKVAGIADTKEWMSLQLTYLKWNKGNESCNLRKQPQPKIHNNSKRNCRFNFMNEKDGYILPMIQLSI